MEINPVGGNCPGGWELPRWVGIYMGGNLHGWEFTGWELPGWELPGWELPGWEFTGWEFTGWELPGWELPGWELPCYHYTPRLTLYLMQLNIELLIDVCKHNLFVNVPIGGIIKHMKTIFEGN